MYRLKTKVEVRPILKWAGGKSQLLPVLLPMVPVQYDRYVEPFLGGAALFFALQPEKALLSDSNPELINLYRQVADDVDGVIAALQGFVNTREDFYRIRAMDWQTIDPSVAAARMIYLNRTCFNGLYRVNRDGRFNVPFGDYRHPKICDEANLRAASGLLRRADIRCADYLEILDSETRFGDFVFLDPPYVPVGEYGDFKRYTKEQFYDEDQVRLSEAVQRLRRRNVRGVLTNSNHPRVLELYHAFSFRVEKTRRNISCRSGSRTGEDVVVTILPQAEKQRARYETVRIDEQVERYPKTRYMGSKRKLLSEIWKVASRFEFDSVLDLFSGSGVVSYMFKAQGKCVLANDYMHMSSTFAKAMIENDSVTLSEAEVAWLLERHSSTDGFVATTFKGLYFTDAENQLIDVVRSNVAQLPDPYKKAIAVSALIRACTKKRPRGLFTYTGVRYDDGRKDLLKSMSEQFREAVEAVNAAVFDTGRKCVSVNGDALNLEADMPDLVYLDPPYYSPQSDNEYVRRYHFLEGIARNWKGVEIQAETSTKKFKSYPTPFSSLEGATRAFDTLFARYRQSLLIVSYSSNSLPTRETIEAIMRKYKRNVEVVPIDYRYSFGNRGDGRVKRDRAQEYLFVGY